MWKKKWKCSHQQENELRKPLHREAELPQEAMRANQRLHAWGLSTGTSYTLYKPDTLQTTEGQISGSL